jgi:hypothetical protein
MFRAITCGLTPALVAGPPENRLETRFSSAMSPGTNLVRASTMLDSLARLLQGGMAFLLSLATPQAASQSLASAPEAALVAAPPQARADAPAAVGSDAPDPVSAPAATADQASAEPEAIPPLAAAVRVFVHGGVLFIPAGFHSQDGSYDLIVHFNGAPQSVEPAVQNLGINAVLYTINLGVGSGIYEQTFQDEHALDRALLGLQPTLRRKLPCAGLRQGRLALSAWSAGYGAIARVLSYHRLADRVDAVLLADGLHASFRQGSHTDVSDIHMAPFSHFAAMAVRGEKLMGISHSSVETFSYASTTRTASALIRWFDVPKAAADGPTLRGGPPIYRADRGGLHVLGYAGDDKEAHCDHLLELDKTLMPMLRERWAR